MNPSMESPDKSHTFREFERVIREAPRGSSEYRLYYGKNTKPITQAIEHRIGYLKSRANHLSSDYRQAAIALLEEELSTRRPATR